MTTEPPRTDVVAIIAAYNPAADLIDTVTTLQQQIRNVIVVDDGSATSARSVLKELAAVGVLVLFQGNNLGIAAALNAGITEAKGRWNPAYFLTLDQDSVICQDYVQKALLTLQHAHSAGVNVGFVTAESYSGHAVPVLFRKDGFAHGFDPMQSGFFIPRETLSHLGNFDESYFIDGVDSEFTMRVRAAGLAVIIGNGCSIAHDLGERSPAMFFGRQLRLFGRTISYNYHSPSRVYYICRNGTVLTKTYIRNDVTWVLRRLTEELKAHALRFAFSPNRRSILKACIWGFRDASRGAMGRIPAYLEQQLRK